jgi:hypothetical protein
MWLWLKNGGIYQVPHFKPLTLYKLYISVCSYTMLQRKCPTVVLIEAFRDINKI